MMQLCEAGAASGSKLLPPSTARAPPRHRIAHEPTSPLAATVFPPAERYPIPPASLSPTATMAGLDPRMMKVSPRLRYNTIGGVNGPLVILDNVRSPYSGQRED